jgi:CRISPR system Cascade subunit CasA
LSFNLLVEPWIPVAGPNGVRRQVCVAEAMAGLAEGERIGWPRADFTGATHEFLIGLLHLSDLLPIDDEDWRDRWDEPPSAAEMKRALEPLRPAFDLDAPGMRVLQDAGAAVDGKAVDVAALLIDAPGENARARNMDIFVKRGVAATMCPACAAAALITMQTYAPSGGQGHRTSLRGGGPLTTLCLVEGAGYSLWHTLWANVLPRDALAIAAGGDPFAPGPVLPWTAPLRISEGKGTETRPGQAPFLQAFFGQPRRYWLDFDAPGSGACGLCGAQSDRLVSRVLTKPRGVNYEGGWRHPLSAYSQDGTNLETLAARKGSPAGPDYRDWLGLVEVPGGDGGKGRQRLPALVVDRFRTVLRTELHQDSKDLPFRLWAFGYDTDNMKARGWNDSRMPLLPKARDAYGFAEAVRRAVAITDEALYALIRSLRTAVLGESGDAKAEFPAFRAEFLAATQADFFALLGRLRDRDKAAGVLDPEDVAEDLMSWHRAVARAALATYDGAIDMTRLDAGEAFDQRAKQGDPRPPRWVVARKNLIGSLRGARMRKASDLDFKPAKREAA